MARLTFQCQVMGKMPVSRSPIASKAPVERSRDHLDAHVGQASWTMAITDLPLAVLVMVSERPQSLDCFPMSPY